MLYSHLRHASSYRYRQISVLNGSLHATLQPPAPSEHSPRPTGSSRAFLALAMLLGLHKTAEPLRVVAIFAGFKYGHVTVRYSPQRDLWAMPRGRMAPLGGLSVLPHSFSAGGESSEWATRITLIPRFQTPPNRSPKIGP